MYLFTLTAMTPESQIWKRAEKITRNFSLPGDYSQAGRRRSSCCHLQQGFELPGRAFAVVYRGKTASAMFACYWDRIEAQPQNFSKSMNAGKLDLSLDADFVDVACIVVISRGPPKSDLSEPNVFVA